MEFKRNNLAGGDTGLILLAEDRQDDVLLIKKAFAQLSIVNPLHVVRDGEELIFYLEGIGRYSNRGEFPLPDLLLLDLKMPKVDGFEALQWIRNHPSLKRLRVIVLTASEDIHHANKAYRMGANSFLVKPLEFENLTALTRTMAEFWIEHSSKPRVERSDIPDVANESIPNQEDR